MYLQVVHEDVGRGTVVRKLLVLYITAEFQWMHSSSSSVSRRHLMDFCQAISYPRCIPHGTLLPLFFDDTSSFVKMD